MLYEKALIFATKAHGKQKRRNGDLYIIHPIRVSQEVKTEKQRVIALVHDTVEDTEVTLAQIEEEFGTEIMYAVDCLTKRKDEPHDRYISRVLTNPDSVAVKIADICDNLSDAPSDEQIRKNASAIVRLVNPVS
jgi:guanosine-3',5'-bis(diphosphate) 3'-pyrophosphohydrolase